MKRDEPYEPSTKSKSPPTGLSFRLVERRDRQAVAVLMAERNPHRAFADVLSGTDRELALVESDSNYRVYVTELNNEVVGFCRFYHSSGLPKEKCIHPAPSGWYAMGIMVNPKFRRQGIAEFLSAKRIAVLREMRVKEVYSLVDEKNLTSQRMHQKFGFQEVAQGAGFLHITFEAGTGRLFRLTI